MPVLLEAVLETLSPRAGEVFVDCTAGLGGHAAAVGARVGAGGVVVLNDADEGNLARARERVEAAGQGGGGGGAPTVHAIRGNFADVGRRVAELGLAADVVLADLGFASTQLEDPERGLSFMREGPLDMRFDQSGGATASDLVNTLSAEELGEILRDFGEERQARRVALKIVDERARSPITTTARLASIVQEALGPRGGGPRIHPATRTFQALRIAVNDELGCLGTLLESVRRAAFMLRAGADDRSGSWLRRGARVGVISFHSLEDRLVKRTFSEMNEQGLGERLTRRPVEADAAEQARNPRARSARLRVVRVDPVR